MNIQAVLLFVTATVNSLLSLFVIIGKRDRTNIVYSVFVVFASFWAAGLAFFIIETDTVRALYIADSYYVSALGIPIFFYYFSLIFLNKNLKVELRHVVVFIPLVVLTIIFLKNPNFLIEKIFWENANKDVVINHINYLIYALFFILFVTLAYINLFKSYFSRTDPKEKNQLKLILLGTSIGFIFGMIFDLILPFWGDYKHIFAGPIFSLFMVGSIAYAITKYQMFNIKVVVTQTFIIILWVFISIRIIIANSFEEQTINVVLLLATIIIGILIVRSVKKEVEQREHIEKLAVDLEGANEKLKELDEMKSEFLSLATHQIRAPLTAIKGYSSMLIEGDFGVLPQKAHDSVRTIMKSCQNLINIVEDFLNISRIEQGRMVYEKTVFEIGELVKEVAEELAPNVQNAGLKLEVAVPDGFSAKVNADRNKIKQVIGNIIDNAIKYTLHGSIKVSVNQEKNLSAPAGKVKITVQDTGIGIAPEEVGKLFAKFSRAKDANKINVRGTGLGLYIAKKMTEAHGGDILVSSPGLGHGTTFTVELPVHNG